MRIEELTQLPLADLEQRASEAAVAAQQLIDTARFDARDLTADEARVLSRHKADLESLRAAIALVEERQRDEQVADRTRLLAHGIETRGGYAPRAPALLVSEAELRKHAEALREGRTYSCVETRAAVYTVGGSHPVGSPGDWAGPALADPRHVIGYAGLPVQPLTGTRPQAAVVTLPEAASGVTEANPHPEYDAVNSVAPTVLRYGRWSRVSAAVNEFDSLQPLNTGHAIGIARDLDAMAVAALETAAGAPAAYVEDVAGAVRLALATVAANTYGQVETFTIAGNPAALALLQDVSPTSGADAGSVVSVFAGAKLYPTHEATDGVLTVFNPSAFLVFMGGLQSATYLDPKDGSSTFGSWLHASDVVAVVGGGAAAVTTVGP